MTANHSHPTHQTLAAFVEGRLDRDARVAVLAHLDVCESCVVAVEVANETFADERPAENVVPIARRFSRWWLAAAAAAVLLLFAIPYARTNTRAPIAQLAALAPADIRAVEPRLSGGFGWAPYRGPMRATGRGTDTRTLRLFGKAADIIDAAKSDRSASALHASGVAMLLIDDGDDSIARLQQATTTDPKDAKIWSDLAAAQYATASLRGRPSLLPEALASADRALRLDPKLAEAQFNRALILEALGVTQDARVAWEQYLELDASSQWANEARDRLRRLPRETTDARFREELPRLERAVAQNDAATVRAIVKTYPQPSRAWGEAEWLGAWGAGTTTSLDLARAAGDALGAESNEWLLRDSVRAIDDASPELRELLAQAHVAYRTGRIAYSRGRPAEAEADLRRAADQFTRVKSPMQWMALYFAACARFDQNDATTATRELETLLDAANARPRYTAFGAHVRWELGLARMTGGDWSGALPLLDEAASRFARLREASNEAFVQTLRADAFAPLGRPDEAWAARVRSLQAASLAGYGVRLPVSLGAAARMELGVGHFDSARSLLALEEQATRSTKSDALIVDVLVREAVLAAKLDEDASEIVRDAESHARAIADADLRARAFADLDFARGAIASQHDRRAATMLLTRAIDAYRARQLTFYLAEALLLRGRAAETREAALADFEAGMTLVERNAVPVAGCGVLDASNALYEDAIVAQLDRDDVAGAFATAERARESKRFVSLAELQTRLRGSGTTVVEIATLPREIVAFFVSADRVEVRRTPIDRDRVPSLDEVALYGALVKPAEPLLLAGRRVIFAPDRHLADVPFAALHDGERYLLERVSIAAAPSATSLQVLPDAHGPRSLVAVVLPSGEENRTVALLESGAEIDDVRGFYDQATVLPPQTATFDAFRDAVRDAGVVHVAGHTSREPGLGDDALTFAGKSVNWRAITAAALPKEPIVILAACETLRRPSRADARTLSLGGGFLAAGARGVIGTLTPIADADARELFRAVHRALSSGLQPAEALRSVQLSELKKEAPGQRRAWRSLALLTRAIEGGD